MHFKDLESSDEDEDVGRKSGGKKKVRSKECPGCGTNLSVSIKQCPSCDYQFTSKSMLMVNSTQTAAEESKSIRKRFPFEPERVRIELD